MVTITLFVVKKLSYKQFYINCFSRFKKIRTPGTTGILPIVCPSVWYDNQGMSSVSVINLSSWLIKSTQVYLTMKNTMKMPVEAYMWATWSRERWREWKRNDTSFVCQLLSYPGQINRSRANLCCGRLIWERIHACTWISYT